MLCLNISRIYFSETDGFIDFLLTYLFICVIMIKRGDIMTGKIHATAGVVFGLASVVLLNQISHEDVLGFSTALNVNEIFHRDFIHNEHIVESLKNIGLVLFLSFVGSLLPDIDHPTSTASKKMFLLSLPYRILQFIFGKIKFTKDFVGHRGITHSLLFLSIPIILMLFVFQSPYLKASMFGLGVGIFSHIFMDMLNPHGVPILMPLSKKTFRLLPKKLCIRTK